MRKLFRRLLGRDCSGNALDVELSLICAALDEEFGSLPPSSLTVDKTWTLDVPLSSAPELRNQFSNFLNRYFSRTTFANSSEAQRQASPELLRSVNEDLKALREKHQVLCSCADIALSFLSRLESLEPTLSGVMRRFVFRHLSVLNPATRGGILDYKSGLPKVGLLFFPNTGERDFLVDALNGIAQVDDMEPGRLLERTWVGRPYDFHRYQTELKKRVQGLVAQLPEDLVRQYPSCEWLEQELIENIQYQFALVQLLKRNEWNLIILGANEVPLGLLLYDLDKESLPPVVFMCHGMLAGDPVMDFWFRFDKTLAKGSVEKSYFLRAGVEPEKIVALGSTALDAFPSDYALSERRRQARVKLGLSLEQTVVVYALTYDIYREDISESVLALIVEGLKQSLKLGGIEDPVLFLKYHPSPSSDPTFSYSRNQYPLARFLELGRDGFSIRLLSDLAGSIEAADCFIAHESSTLFQALESGVPSLSILFNEGNTLPTMGFELYQRYRAHQCLSIADGAERIGAAINELCRMERQKSFGESRSGWSEIFPCGRTESLGIVIELLRQLLAKGEVVGTAGSAR